MKKFFSSFLMLAASAAVFAGVTVKVDDPSKVLFYNSSTYSAVTLEPGENTVDAGSYRVAGPQEDYKYQINYVKLNGEFAEPSYGSYYFSEYSGNPLKDGDVVEIRGAYDKTEFDVTVACALDGVVTKAEYFEYAGSYSYTTHEAADPKAYKAPAGYPTTIYFNTADFAVSKITVNGEEVEVRQSIEVAAKSDITIEVEAKTKGMAKVAYDNADKIRLMNSSYNDVVLDQPVLEVAEGTYRIGTKSSFSYSYVLNKVFKNGEEVAMGYSGWEVTLAAGDSLYIMADYAANSYAVTVDAAEGVVTAARSNGKSVENPYSFDAEAGYGVEMTLNTDDYQIDSVLVNGVKQSSTYNVQFYAKSAANVKVFAQSFGMVNGTLTLTDPAHVQVYYGNSYEAVAGLLAGDNAVSLSSKYPTVRIGEAAGCIIDSVVVDGAKLTKGQWDDYYNATLKDGGKIEVFSHAKEYPFALTVVTKDLSEAGYSKTFESVTTDYNRESYTLVEGANTIRFDETAASFSFAFYGSNLEAWVTYVNGVKLEDDQYSYRYTGGGNGSLVLADGDYVEFFFKGGQSEYTPTGVVATEAGEKAVKVLRGGQLLILRDGKYYSVEGNRIQ